MPHRKQAPRIQLNLNIPEDLHTDFEAARKAARIQFKQQALCEAMAVWVELGPYLTQFRSLPDAEFASDKKFARTFVEWFQSGTQANRHLQTSLVEIHDRGPMNELQQYIEPLRDLTHMLNEILNGMAHKSQGTKKTIGSETDITGETSAGPRDSADDKTTADQEELHIREIGEALDHSAQNRARIERDRRGVEKAIDDIERESDGDCELEKRTA